jgi:hypothetical protein
VEPNARRPVTLSRRFLIGLALAAAVEAAYGANSSADASAAITGSTSTKSRAEARGSVVQIGGTHVPASEQISTSDARRLAARSNGHWQGGWHDSTGKAGTSDLVISLDASSRKARASLAFGGDLLGSQVSDATYEIDLLSFIIGADSYDIKSPQFGNFNIVPGGANAFSATAQSVPGHPEISSVDINEGRISQRVDVNYTIKYVDGHSVHGTMALTRSGERAKPAALPKAGSQPNPVDIQSGVYAASLLTGSDLTTVFASRFPAPRPNGGRLYYANGIDTSNASAGADHYNVSYTVYLGDSPAATSAFWTQQGSGLAIPGSWKAAFWLSETSTLYVYATDTRILTIEVSSATGDSAPTAAELSKWQQYAEAIATKIVAALSSG